MKTPLRINPLIYRWFWVLVLFACATFPLEANGSPAPNNRGRAGSAALGDTSAALRVFRPESVRVTGNRRASEQTILGYLLLRPGDAITPEAIDSARRRLVATDYFSEVSLSTRPGTLRGAVVLVIEVKEHGYPTFETGFGFHDRHGWFLTLGGLRFDNPFGFESRLRVGARLGFRLAGVDAEWTKPLSPGGSFELGIELHSYAMQHRFFGSGPDDADNPPWADNDWRRFQQNIQRAGGEIALNYGGRRSTRFSFGVRAEYVNPDSTFKDWEDDKELSFGELPGALKENVDDTALTGFFLRAIRDTRDNPVYPRSGSYSRLTIEVNNSLLGGDEIFSKTEADFRLHAGAAGGWIVAGRVNAGITTRGTPYYDRFYLGGIYSVRGFEEWSLSNTDGSDGFWFSSLELRWPLAGRGRSSSTAAPPRLSGVVFLDAGQGWHRDEKFSTSGVESAAGYGMRLRLPWLGTLGFDIGIPISAGRTGDPFRAHGSLGFSF
jgi:outer membrane protein insertion porin family